MSIMSPITARGRQAFRRAPAEAQTTHWHSHRTGVVKTGNYYAGHHTAQGTLITVMRSGRTKPLDPVEQARVRRQRHRESKRNAGMVPAEIWLPKAWRDAVIARGETLQDAAQKAFQLLIAHWKSNQAS